MQTAIQLYTLRGVEKPYADLLADVAGTTFDGVEFAHRVGEEDPAAVRETLDEHGLEAASAHVGADAIEADVAAVAETARTLGYDDIVVPWLDQEHFESVAAVEETADLLARLGEQLAAEGLTLHYHNHDQEFADTDEGVAFHVLADRTDDLLFEVDAGWALAGGADPVDLLHRYADRITHVHVKDVSLDGDDVPALGDGDLDVEAVVAAARAVDAEWLIYENDRPADPATAHEHGSTVFAEHV